MTNSPANNGTCFSLIAKVRARERKAWDDFVDLYAPLIVYWVRQNAIAADDIDDCLQEIFTAIARGIDRYERSKGSFRGWLWGITQNKCRDRFRKARRDPALGEGGTEAQQALLQHPEYSDDEIDPDEYQELLLRALQQVKPEFEEKSWDIFIRAVVDEVPTELVASEYDVTAATVRKHKSRILARMRQQLGDEPG